MRAARAVPVVVTALVLLLFFGVPLPRAVALQLAFGWAGFLAETLPRVSLSPVMAATAAVTLAALVLLSHRLFRSFHGAWRPAWTGMALGLVVLLFAAGLGAVGVAHQTVWLVTSKTPLLRNENGVDPDWLLESFKRMEAEKAPVLPSPADPK